MDDKNNYVGLRAQWRENLEKLSDLELRNLAIDMGFKVRYSETYTRLTEPKGRLIMKIILDDPYHFKNLKEAWKRRCEFDPRDWEIGGLEQ